MKQSACCRTSAEPSRVWTMQAPSGTFAVLTPSRTEQTFSSSYAANTNGKIREMTSIIYTQQVQKGNKIHQRSTQQRLIGTHVVPAGKNENENSEELPLSFGEFGMNKAISDERATTGQSEPLENESKDGTGSHNALAFLPITFGMEHCTPGVWTNLNQANYSYGMTLSQWQWQWPETQIAGNIRRTRYQ